MSMLNIKELNEAIAEEFEIEADQITTELPLKETLSLDSLSLLDLISVVSDMTGLKLKGPEVSQIKTFGELYAFIEKNLVK